MAVGQVQHVSWLEDAAKDVLSRAETYEFMRKSYAVGDYARKHCDFVDFLRVYRRQYQGCFGVAIPEELFERVHFLFLEGDQLGFGIFDKPSELRISLAPQPYIEFFERCRDAQMELHRILVNQLMEHSGNQN